MTSVPMTDEKSYFSFANNTKLERVLEEKEVKKE